jgi:hypothetical protein
MKSTVPNGPESFGDKANELATSFDQAVDEAQRRVAEAPAIGARCDPKRLVGQRTYSTGVDHHFQLATMRSSSSPETGWWLAPTTTMPASSSLEIPTEDEKRLEETMTAASQDRSTCNRRWVRPAAGTAAAANKALTPSSHTGDAGDPTLVSADASKPAETRFSADIACKRYHPTKEKKMKLQYVATLAIAASAAAIGLAPIAAADATVQQSPGNAQIVATPGAAAQEAAQNQQPFGGDQGALLYHHR